MQSLQSRWQPRTNPDGERLGWGLRDEFQYPFIASQVPPALREQDYDQIETKFIARVRTFELWVPEQLKSYTELLTSGANGLVHIICRERHWSDEHRAYAVYCEWLEGYSVANEKLMEQWGQGRVQSDSGTESAVSGAAE